MWKWTWLMSPACAATGSPAAEQLRHRLRVVDLLAERHSGVGGGSGLAPDAGSRSMDHPYTTGVHCAMEFAFDRDKNAWLVATRGVSFENVIEAIGAGFMLDVFEHPNQRMYPGQVIIVVRMNDYSYCVPADVRGTVYHLRTVYPCRKFKRLLEGDGHGQ